MTEKHKYKKLGGWLLMFVIYYFLQVCGVFLQFGEGGMLDILRGWQMYDGAQGWLLLGSQVLSLLLIIVYVFTALELVRRDPYFLHTRQLAFIFTGLDIVLRMLCGFIYGFEGFGLPALLLQEAFLVLGLLFIMLYYTRSVRVRTYMGSDEYLREAFFTKKVKSPVPVVPDERDENLEN